MAMRVCPKCKYVDPPEWRHSRFSYWLDIITFEDFERLHPKLAKLLEVEKVTEDEDYFYRRANRYVERKAKIDLPDRNQWREQREKPKLHQKMPDLRRYWDLGNRKAQRKLTSDEIK